LLNNISKSIQLTSPLFASGTSSQGFLDTIITFHLSNVTPVGGSILLIAMCLLLLWKSISNILYFY